MSIKAKEKKEKAEKDRIPSFQEFLAMVEKNRSHCTKDDVIKSLREEIESYEKKYKMKTSEFIKRYDSGEFEMDDNFPDYELFIWRNSYRSYQELTDEKAE